MTEPGELCEICQCRYSTVYTVPDRLWAIVTGHRDGSGLWCPACLDAEARRMGIVLYWTCAQGAFPGEQDDGETAKKGLVKLIRAKAEIKRLRDELELADLACNLSGRDHVEACAAYRARRRENP